MDWIDLAQDRGRWRGSYERRNKFSGSIKWGAVIYWLITWEGKTFRMKVVQKNGNSLRP